MKIVALGAPGWEGGWEISCAEAQALVGTTYRGWGELTQEQLGQLLKDGGRYAHLIFIVEAGDEE